MLVLYLLGLDQYQKHTYIPDKGVKKTYKKQIKRGTIDALL